MPKRNHWLTLFCLAGLFLSACQSVPVTTITGTERDELIKAAEPMEDNLIANLKSGDFNAFCKDFDASMKSAFKETDFTTMRATFSSKLGDYQSRTVTEVQSTTDSGKQIYLVIYTLKYSKSSAVTQRLVLSFSKPYQVSGLWYNSPELNQ